MIYSWWCYKYKYIYCFTINFFLSIYRKLKFKDFDDLITLNAKNCEFAGNMIVPDENEALNFLRSTPKQKFF